MPASTYERQKEIVRAIRAEQSKTGRDVAPIPPVKKPRRKSAARRDFKKFCKSYFPDVFTLKWSDDHLKVIGQIEESVLHGGLFATAMPRGSGKSSLAEVACLWAILYGHRDFICLIGSDEGRASGMLESIKTHCEVNELLLEDFPEAIHPIRKLEGISHRCNGQLFNGERTCIGWTADELIMPTIPGSKASGAIVKVAGITGGIRGMKFTRQDGKTVRPSLVIVDDPQTDQSARSPSQCETRERILAGAILGLAGPGKKISGIMPCTVICASDMADNILNREKHPEWNGTRTKMVYSFPSNNILWDEYAKILGESLRSGDAGKKATEFYRQNRVAMDEGAVVAWSERFNSDEESAIQHAMNLKIRDDRAFFAEFQNDPLPEEVEHSEDMTADEIADKINRYERGLIPLACQKVTAFIDVQGELLFWCVAAWADKFTGYVIDYGSFPDQKMAYFSLRDVRYPLSGLFPGRGMEGVIYAGLESLANQLLTKDWPRDDGATLKIERCLVDANWGNSTKTVYDFVRQSQFSAILMPSHGKYVGAASIPMSEYRQEEGSRVGLNWMITLDRERRPTRRVIYDTNFWKSFVYSRLATAMGDPGSLSLFGDNPSIHRLFSDHLAAEFRVRTQGRGRECDEWKLKGRADNHWLDCVVGCSVAASMQGISTAESAAKLQEKRKRVSFAELQRAKMGKDGAIRA
jgi:hypothetical protein